MSNVLNTEMLEELKMIMEDEFPSLLETFLSESAKQYAQVNSAWGETDFDQLRRAAHSLKGSSANIGAEQLQGTCQDLETMAHQNQPDHIPSLIAQVGDELAQVNRALSEM